MIAQHLWLAGGLTVSIIVVGMVLAKLTSEEMHLKARLLAVQQRTGIDQVAPPRSARSKFLRMLQQLGGLLTGSGVVSGKTASELEQTLKSAGFRGDRALSVFIGAKVIALLGLPLLVWLAITLTGTGKAYVAYAVPAAAIVGMLLPDFVAKQLRKRYLAELERGLPDALDLMVICAEAGLSLEAAIERVTREIALACPAVATEFGLCNSELRILADRRAALMNMAGRTGLDQLRRLGTTLSQTLKLGTPLVQALRALSAEMRHEQLMAFEARAARLPVLLTVPMITFILPTLIIVAAGPAIIELLRQM